MTNNLGEFAQQYGIPILNSYSEFPNYFATHALEPNFNFSATELMSSDELNSTNLTTNIDILLGTTNNVFFALGKGYLESKDSIGLVYDPFIIVESAGVAMVMNDLLYTLNGTQLLQSFCNEHKQEFEKVMGDNLSKKEQKKFWQAVGKGESLLIGDEPGSTAYIFDKQLAMLSTELKSKLSEQLKSEVVEPNVITKNLSQVVKDVFREDDQLMNSFSDKTTEERVVEILVPKSYPIDKGLLAVYVA